MRQLDHIVYAVPDLERATKEFAAQTGITPVFGGYHTTQGTKNALVRIGEAAYLEFLAGDAQNTSVPQPRWMGIDLIRAPLVSRWSLKSRDLDRESEVLDNYLPGLGQIIAGQRETASGDLLRWRMSLPQSAPAVEVAPFFTAWSAESIHPSAALDPGCTLHSLQLFHPHPRQVERALQELDVEVPVAAGEMARIAVGLRTPRGLVKL